MIHKHGAISLPGIDLFVIIVSGLRTIVRYDSVARRMEKLLVLAEIWRWSFSRGPRLRQRFIIASQPPDIETSIQLRHRWSEAILAFENFEHLLSGSIQTMQPRQLFTVLLPFFILDPSRVATFAWRVCFDIHRRRCLDPRRRTEIAKIVEFESRSGTECGTCMTSGAGKRGNEDFLFRQG